MNAYLSNVWLALQGRQREGYSEANTVVTTVETTTGVSKSMGGMAILMALIGLLPYFLFAYGAGKLSWCLNHSYGWSFLCFLFPGFYYPYYAFMLNPLCNTPMVGGRRR